PTKAYLAPFCTQTRTQAAGAIPPSVCLAPHMSSLTFPVKVWVLPAAMPGMTVNPVLSTTVAIQTCTIRKRDINPPLFYSPHWYWMLLYRNPDFFFDPDNTTLGVQRPQVSFRSYNCAHYEQNASCSVLHSRRSPSDFSGSSAIAQRKGSRHTRRCWSLFPRTYSYGRRRQTRLRGHGQGSYRVWFWWNAEARSRSRNQLGWEGEVRGTSRPCAATSIGISRLEG